MLEKGIGIVSLLVLSQLTQSVPTADKLHEAFNAVTLSRGSDVKLVSDGCQTAKGGNYVCYYTIWNNVRLDATSFRRNERLQIISAEAPKAPNADRRLARLAAALMIVLRPGVSESESQKVLETLSTNSAFGIRDMRILNLSFQLDPEERTLKIYVDEP